ncbi:sensor histidine kinase [Ruminiclostridium josui]|nr:HAMP domain-containing sensor histidine kinase [Ruminiclostridium josui]
MQSISSGTQILTHAIKNEILKISLCTRNINSSQTYFDKEIFDRYIGENTKNITASTDYLMTLVTRIKDYMHEIEIKEDYHNLADIIENSLNLMIVHIKEKNISIKRYYSYGQFGTVLLCDAVHIQEVLNNILKNAVEALQPGGEIGIHVVESKKILTVEVRDNGPGISPSNLARIFDPFFSTKKNSMNFGLGLSYCYNVMHKHGGDIEVESDGNNGTAVILKFLSKKVKKVV